MGDDPCLQIPYAAHSAAGAAGDADVVGQHEADAFYHDIAAGWKTVRRYRDCLDATCMLCPSAVGLGQDDAKCRASVNMTMTLAFDDIGSNSPAAGADRTVLCIVRRVGLDVRRGGERESHLHSAVAANLESVYLFVRICNTHCVASIYY